MLRSLSQINARQVSDETTCVGSKCCLAKVLFPAPAIPHSTISVLVDTWISRVIPFPLLAMSRPAVRRWEEMTFIQAHPSHRVYSSHGSTFRACGGYL